ncbi:hypothetical protein [Rhodococcus rhodochrous]|uniref:Uncharacterized protein n=1 Tax=Rhodococcus rhodochrous KG-21 TaxID=1441923 RepID=A0A0M9WM51_RHORH|nr:hypothetical protein [Rhodococcus rhodochrous]KOS54150.1 hypothetical protein Z051_21720 [Rhodococcus rhodochrous KG-21]
MPLRRLLAVATLTRAQAALLVDDLICRLERRRHRCPSRLRDDAVTVSETGRLTIAWNGSATDGHAADESAARLLRGIVTSCHCPEWAEQVNESIDEATDLADLTHRVRHTIAAGRDPAEESRVRSQLAALVAVMTGRPFPDGPAVARVDAPRSPDRGAGTSLAPAGWYPPVRSGWHRRRRRPSRRQGVLGLVAILILVGTLWVAPRAWEELRRGWDAVLNPVDTGEPNRIEPVSPPPPEPEGGQDGSAGGAGTTAPGPVQVGAPASAGPIRLVTATFANGECAPGRMCAVRVDVHLDPTASAGTVTWALNVYDRCSGAVGTSAEVSLAAQPGEEEVYGISWADLPPGRALAVAAVTSAPAAAASEPLSVPAENATC